MRNGLNVCQGFVTNEQVAMRVAIVIILQKNFCRIKEMEERSRYIIGIDLGTTNSAVCYVDTGSCS